MPDSSQAQQREVIRRVLKDARPYYPRLALAMFFGVLAGLGPLSYPIGLQRIIDDALIGAPSALANPANSLPGALSGIAMKPSATAPNAAVTAAPRRPTPAEKTHRDVNLLYIIVAALFVINLIAYSAQYGQSYLTAWSGQRLVANLRVRLFDRVLSLPLGEFDKWRPGEFLSRFSNDLAIMTDAVSISLPQLFQTLITLAGALYILFSHDWLLTLCLLVFAPVVNYVVATFTRLISQGTQSTQERVADLSANLTETLQAQRIVKAFRREKYESERFRNNNEAYFGAFMKLTQLGLTQTPVVGMILAVAMLAIVLFSAREVIVGRMKPGEVFLFWGAVVVAINPINRFATYVGDLSKGVIGASRVYEVLDLPSERDDEGAAAIAPAEILGALQFENVTFAYDLASAPVLHDLSAGIEAGEIVALVGPSGAGKTTIVNLVPRFYKPQIGRITLDGIDLARLSLSALRGAIAIVPQEPLLFSGTIEENIRYGRLDATRAEIESAAREANADEFVREFPQGYETRVGDRGVRLSGGQRQRISIARAVLRDPRILILDEATSALDSHSERLIEAALDRLLPGRTTLIIAHRLSTIRRAHKILYIDAGRVVEAGSHQELMAAGGAYARLHAAQFVS
ncbi:MAG: ABC transporter ATP-binding protein [Candidatus Eremiobacteraeota bacterium]|nr:ABC transporter ATP-binding protein [Candidatus Eremiobacteraeota bacterium]